MLFVVDQRPYQATLDQAKASQASAKARVSFSQTDLERAQDLTRTGNITEQTTDQRRQVAADRPGRPRRAKAPSAGGAEPRFHEVRAPVAGKIGRRLVSEGNIVIADRPKLTTIVSLDPIYFSSRSTSARSSTTSESSASAWARTDGPGPSDAHGDRGRGPPKHKGVLDFVDNSVDNATGTMLLRATVENRDRLIKPGLFGVSRCRPPERYKGMLIPDEAVATNQDKRIVYVLADDDTVSAREVRVGRQDRRLPKHLSARGSTAPRPS